MRVKAIIEHNYTKMVVDVLAKINKGFYEKYLVVNKHELFLVDSLHQKDGKVNSNIKAITNSEYSGWIECNLSKDSVYNDELVANDLDKHVYYYNGYQKVFDNLKSISYVFKGEKHNIDDFDFVLEVLEQQKDDWRYIETDNDIHEIMSIYNGFHDSVLKNIRYTSGSYMQDGRLHCVDDIRSVEMVFEGPKGSIVLELFGLIAFCIRPAKPNFTSEILDVKICFDNDIMYFYDSNISKVDEFYEGTWGKAYGARWKVLEGAKDIS